MLRPQNIHFVCYLCYTTSNTSLDSITHPYTTTSSTSPASRTHAQPPHPIFTVLISFKGKIARLRFILPRTSKVWQFCLGTNASRRHGIEVLAVFRLETNNPSGRTWTSKRFGASCRHETDYGPVKKRSLF